MDIKIIALGKARKGPELELLEEYRKRLPWNLTVVELECKKALSGPSLKEEEGKLLLAAIPQGAFCIAMDERGKAQTSEQFAAKMGDLMQQGIKHCCFLIGGADGLSDAVRARAKLLLAFGTMTWPHMLVRAMLAEQLYRAHTILTKHPYHRA